MPCLALRGVARDIAGSVSLRAKILLCKQVSFLYNISSTNYLIVNVENDRETTGYSAVDYIQYAFFVDQDFALLMSAAEL